MKKITIVLVSVVIAGASLIWFLKHDIGENNRPSLLTTIQKTKSVKKNNNQPTNSLKKEVKYVVNTAKTFTPPTLPSSKQLPPINLVQASVKKRQLFFNDLLKQDSMTTFLQLINLLSPPTQEDRIVEGLLIRALSYQLQHSTNNEEIYNMTLQLLNDPIWQNKIKLQMVELMGRTATPGSLEVLLAFALTYPDSSIEFALRKNIANIGDMRWDGRFHSELSPLLENKWRVETDERLTSSLAIGLAKVGAPEGVALLLSEVLKGGTSIEDFSRQEDPKIKAAFHAIKYVRNPKAVSVLENVLNNSAGSNLAVDVSGTTLSTMGRVEATKVLLKWAQNASDESLPFIKKWFSKTRDSKSYQLMDNFVQNKPFVSSRIKSEINVHLRKHDNKMR